MLLLKDLPIEQAYSQSESQDREDGQCGIDSPWRARQALHVRLPACLGGVRVRAQLKPAQELTPPGNKVKRACRLSWLCLRERVTRRILDAQVGRLP